MNKLPKNKRDLIGFLKDLVMIGMKSINKMKIDKYITKTVGYIRFNNIIEFNYSIYEWALPFSFNNEEALFEFRILCLSIIKIKK